MEKTHKKVLDWLEGQLFGNDPRGDVLDQVPNLSDIDAYRLRDALMKRRVAAGDMHIGYKAAGASRAVQIEEHADGPTVGCLMKSALCAESVPISIGAYKRVIVESEAAVLLKHDLSGPQTTTIDALRAIEGIFPAIEVIASREAARKHLSRQMRIIGAKFTGGGIVVGGPMSAPHGIDLRLEGMVISINGVVRGSATGVEVMGDPLRAVAMMANTLAAFGESLKAGMLLMAGSFIGNIPVSPGDDVRVDFTRLGSVGARFAN